MSAWNDGLKVRRMFCVEGWTCGCVFLVIVHEHGIDITSVYMYGYRYTYPKQC